VRLLVSGGAGFIGSEFVRQTVADHPEDSVVVLDKLTYAGNVRNLDPVAELSNFRFVRGDICDAGLVETLVAETDVVVNFAAESHVDRSLEAPGQFIQTDVYGTYVLLEAARRAGHARFVQVSTDEVYGDVEEGTSSEEDPLRPRSPYSASKAGAELMVWAYRASYGMPVITTRGSNTYGPYQYPEKIIPLFITNAIDDQPLPIYGDGSAVRDYLHVTDHARGIDTALRLGTPGEDYNVGYGGATNGHEVADLAQGAPSRPPRTRPAVRRQHVKVARAGLAARDLARPWNAADGELVSRQRVMVASSQVGRLLGVLPAQLQATSGGSGAGTVRILLTGGNGQLGRELVEAATAAGHDVHSTTHADCDITSPDSVRQAIEGADPEVLINCAAWNKVDAAESQSDDAFRVNAVGPRVLAGLCAARQVLLVHLSTDYVFDGSATSPVDEWQGPNPLSMYGASKLAGENEVRFLAPRHQVVRTAWLYGRDGPNFVLSILRAMAEGRPLRVVSDQLGSPTWTGHLAPALLRVIARDIPGTYHLTNSGAVSWHGFAQAIVAAVGSSVDVAAITTAEYPAAARRPLYSVLDNRVWRLLGETALPDWQEGLHAYVAHVRDSGALDR
jgi:dTDP-glucose 4,6-dehydratase